MVKIVQHGMYLELDLAEQKIVNLNLMIDFICAEDFFDKGGGASL